MTPAHELEAEAERLRAVIAGIVVARDREDFDALMAAIDDAKAEAVISAMRRAKDRGHQ
jgi:hypothetical protein